MDSQWTDCMGRNPRESAECIEGSGIKGKLILIMHRSIKLHTRKNTVMASVMCKVQAKILAGFSYKCTMLPPQTFSGQEEALKKVKEMSLCIIPPWSD